MTSLLEMLGGSVGGVVWGGLKLALLAWGSVYLARHHGFLSVRWFWLVLVLNTALFLIVQSGKETATNGLLLFLQGSFAAVASLIVLLLVLVDALRVIARARPNMQSVIFDWAHRQAVHTRNRGRTAVGLAVLGLVCAVVGRLL